MSAPTAELKAGTFSITAHDRIIFGTPAGEAVLAEADRYGAKRIFVTSTRSLAQKNDGPLQRLERALGALHVGTYAAIKSHTARARTWWRAPMRRARPRPTCWWPWAAAR